MHERVESDPEAMLGVPKGHEEPRVLAKRGQTPKASIRSLAVVLSTLSHAIHHKDEDQVWLAVQLADELVRRTQ